MAEFTAVPTGYAQKRHYEQQLVHNTTTGGLLVETALSVLSMSVVTPPTSSKTLAELSVTVVSGLKKLIICASAAGTYVNIGDAASVATMPVPTTPLTIDMTADGAGDLELFGDGSKTVSIIQIG